MNPAIFFTILILIAAAGMLYLSDRGLVRVLGVTSLLVAAPATLLMTVLNWRVELATQPTVLGYSLVAIGGVGTVFLAAALLSTVLRLVLPQRKSLSDAQVVAGTAAGGHQKV